MSYDSTIHLRPFTTDPFPKSARLLSIFASVVMALAACGRPATQPPQPIAEATALTRVPATRAATELPPAGETPASTTLECPLPEPTDANASLRLVYQREDDLWLRDDTGSPRLLMEASQAESLILSPDGTRVIFSRKDPAGGSEVVAIDVSDGSVLTLSGEASIPGPVHLISLSDDEHWLAFAADVDLGRDLWVAAIDGSGARVLVSADELRASLGAGLGTAAIAVNVGWLPESHMLTYVPIAYGPGDAIQFYEPVYLVDADTGISKLLLPVGEGGHLSYAPDGQTMVIADPTRIRLMEASLTNAPRTVLEYPAADFGLESYIPTAAWLPDSSSFLVATPSGTVTPDQFYDTGKGPMSVWSITRDGAVRKLSEYQDAPSFFAFSPDATRYAYYQQHEQVDLHLARVEGSEDWLVTSDEEQGFLGWAPGSHRFAFRSAGEIRIGDLCGESTPGPDLPEIEFLGWLDDSRYLVIHGPRGTWGLYLASIQGAGVLLHEFGSSDLWDYVVTRR